MIERPGPVSEPVLTITADNGREFVGQAEVSRVLGTDFASPACPTPWNVG